MKNTSKILNLLSAFMAVIGACAATLVCFIVLYSQINGGFSPKTHNSSAQTSIIVQTDSLMNNNTNEIFTSSETNPIEDDLTINLDGNNYTSAITNSPEPEVLEPDYDIAFSNNEIYTSTEMQSSEIIETDTQSTGIQSTYVNNFNIYNNPKQQQTTDTFVLNTSTFKVHHPTCDYVAQIAQKNYSTSNLSISELKSQGYTTCGHCFQ